MAMLNNNFLANLLSSNSIIHIIGIGGIGMSAIAEFLHRKNFHVRGDDIVESYTTKRLQDIGIEVIIGHSSRNINNAAVVVRSTAIKEDHIEIIEAKRQNIKILHRSEMLSQLLTDYRVVGVTGTHGKSTTTGMIGFVCVENDLDPTIINGAILNEISSNILIGASNIAVIESDESDKSFLTLPADIGVITNMDADHLDFYGTVEEMYQSYMVFMQKVLNKGMCIICADHKKLMQLASTISDQRNMLFYSTEQDADIMAKNINITNNGMLFDLHFSEKVCSLYDLNQAICNVSLSLYGKHNVLNALASIAVSLTLGCHLSNTLRALSKFQGVKRRFSKIGTLINGAYVIDDYAHHPVEIQATLSVAKSLALKTNGKVIAVMQPHRYTRLATLQKEFAKSFFDADIVILTDVYSAQEMPISGVNSQSLATEIKNNNVLVSQICYQYSELQTAIKILAKENDIIVMMGAGDITDWAKKLVENLGAASV